MPKFEPGKSGNPKGRPRGIRSKIAAALDAMAEDDAAEIYAALKRLAVGGDVAAAKLILDRCWTPPKGRRVALDLPPLRVVGDAAAALAELIRATAAGEITAEEARNLAALVSAWRATAGGAPPPGDDGLADDLDFSVLDDAELRLLVEFHERAAAAARRRGRNGAADDADGSNGLN